MYNISTVTENNIALVTNRYHFLKTDTDIFNFFSPIFYWPLIPIFLNLLTDIFFDILTKYFG